MSFYENLILVFSRSGQALVALFPYVVLGVIAGTALKHSMLVTGIRRVCTRTPLLSIILSSLTGMASPLCTYGTVPIIVQLVREDVPLAPLIAFLSASSLMNPQLFIITWGGLGAEMALVRTAAVFISSILLGILVWVLPRHWLLNTNSLERFSRKQVIKKDRSDGSMHSFLTDSIHMLEFVGFYVIIGILLGAVLETFLPGRIILQFFGTGQFGSVLLAALLGVPMYACGGGTVPLIRSLINQGMAKGAALSFLIIGPATRFTPLMALATIIRPAAVIAYTGYLFVFSIIAGILYQ